MGRPPMSNEPPSDSGETHSAPVCPACGAVAEWMGNHWATGHALDCAWMRDPDSESYG